MGIKDLLRNFESISKHQNINDYKNKRIAVDASGWLHKALYATTEDWINSDCTDTQLYVDFMITRVKNLQQCGVNVVLVFDGKRNHLKVYILNIKIVNIYNIVIIIHYKLYHN